MAMCRHCSGQLRFVAANSMYVWSKCARCGRLEIASKDKRTPPPTLGKKDQDGAVA